MSILDLSDEEFEKRTIAAIQREFGLGGVARFIMTFRSGLGDYTADRRQWLSGLSLEDIQQQLNAPK